MSRCRCCDVELDFIDLSLTQDDGSPEDLCRECRNWVYFPKECEEIDDHEYVHGEATEGLKQIIEVE